MNSLLVVDLGALPYAAALELQRDVARRRISGEFSGKRTEEGALTRKAEAGASSEGKDLTTALLTLLTGGLVGTGLQASGQVSAATAALLGVLGALGAAVTLKVSTSRTLTRIQSWQSTFIPDLRAETLDRVLPVMLERLRDAGLYPVFLVDELDKVEPLSERLLKLVRHLKKLVAEVLDRVDQFPDFDPRKDYRLVVQLAELSQDERRAVSPDDIQLDL